jgi:hypothetical protein
MTVDYVGFFGVIGTASGVVGLHIDRSLYNASLPLHFKNWPCFSIRWDGMGFYSFIALQWLIQVFRTWQGLFLTHWTACQGFVNLIFSLNH